jgi:hypothetical protein
MPHDGASWERFTANTVAFVGPCKLLGVGLRDGGAGTATLSPFDGRDTGGRQFQTFRASANRSEIYLFGDGIKFEQGLFVLAGGNLLEGFVMYEPLPSQRRPPG